MTRTFSTDSAEELRAAVEAATAGLARGEPVALPTETVYGLAADALRPEAVVQIFEAKERPFFDPLIVHLPSRAWLERVAAIPAESRALIEALIAQFWPGPLTLILPRTALVPDLVTAGLETVAVRMSAHPVFRAVIESFSAPLAAPSANRFGRISPTAAEHVRAELGGRIPIIVDGGAAQHGIESTIVAVEGVRLRVLRSGPVTREELASFGEVSEARRTAVPEAPGQLASHYAPRTALRLRRAGERPGEPRFPAGNLAVAGMLPLAPAAAGRAGLLAWTSAPDDHAFAQVEVLSPAGDLREAAATLFSKLRRLDDAGLDLIIAEPVPEHGLGLAIMDRLRKAAAPRGDGL